MCVLCKLWRHQTLTKSPVFTELTFAIYHHPDSFQITIFHPDLFYWDSLSIYSMSHQKGIYIFSSNSSHFPSFVPMSIDARIDFGPPKTEPKHHSWFPPSLSHTESSSTDSPCSGFSTESTVLILLVWTTPPLTCIRRQPPATSPALSLPHTSLD